MTARLATAATAAAGTPGRRRISRSGAAGSVVGAAPGARPCAFELERDRARIRADREREDEPDDAHRRSGEPRDDERVELEVLPGEQRPEHERPERGTEQRAEEDVRDRARLARLRVHVGDGRPREQHGAVHPADAEEAEDDERRRVHDASERGQHAAHRADDEPSRDDGNAPVAIHEPARGQRSERAGGQEDRRPEAEDGLDPGDEDERDRGDGGGELQHAGERHETERQEHRVSPDLALARHSASVSIATMAET